MTYDREITEDMLGKIVKTLCKIEDTLTTINKTLGVIHGALEERNYRKGNKC